MRENLRTSFVSKTWAKDSNAKARLRKNEEITQSAYVQMGQLWWEIAGVVRIAPNVDHN